MKLFKWYGKINTRLSRLWFIYGFVIVFAVILIGKLFVIQIIDGDTYNKKADKQYMVSGVSTYDRGSIFFTEKDGETSVAATLESGFIITINPKILKTPKEAYSAISKIIKIDSNTFFIKASKKDDQYEIIAKHVSEKDGKKIKALGIVGVVATKEKWRYYPAGSTASQVLGFVGYKGNKLVGRYGLEKYYEDVLSRKDTTLYVNLFAEIFTNIKKSLSKNDLDTEGNIYTSIEPSVQEVLENKLNDIKKRWSADSVGGIIINPTNGEIYAMGNIPDFDPNNYNKVKDPSLFIDPLVENVFEMGSIIKPLTMASGIDAGVVTENTEYDDKGYVLYNDRKVYNFDKKGRGVINMQRVLDESLNTGAAFVMEKLGKKRFRDYFLSLGLGKETGVDLPGEVTGLVNNLQSTRDIEYVTASFGQGVAMTPMETVRALSTLGNGGKLVTPHLVTKIGYRDGTSKKIFYGDGQKIFKTETSAKITKMLVGVVDDALFKGKHGLKGYSIAAKTGTAQIARGGVGGYYKNKYLHSFFGYFPAYNPQFLVFLYTVDPKKIRWASQTLIPPFIDITKFLINYYNIPPDR